MISGLLGAVGFVAIGVGLNMVASELFGYGTRAGLWFVHLAVRLLPPDQRDRWREEWEADVIEVAKGLDPNSTGGNHHLTAMAWGFGTLPTAVARSRLLPRWAHNPKAEQQMAGLVFGQVYGLVFGLVFGLFGGLGGGLFGGLGFGLIGGLLLGLHGGACGLGGRLSGRVLGGLSGGLIGVLVGVLVGGLSGGLVDGPSDGLVGGLRGGLVGGLVFGLGPRLSVWCGRLVVGRLRRRW